MFCLKKKGLKTYSNARGYSTNVSVTTDLFLGLWCRKGLFWGVYHKFDQIQFDHLSCLILLKDIYFVCVLKKFFSFSHIQSTQSKISFHYFVFFLFLFSLAKSEPVLRDDSRKFLVTILFFFFFFSSTLYCYLARDSSKKWQEILNKLGMISQIVQLQNFSHYFVFCLINEWIIDLL